MRRCCRRVSIAEVLSEEPSTRVALDAGDIAVIAAHLSVADNHLELQVRIVLIQTRFEIRRRRRICKIHGAPFNIEDTVRRTARYRCKHTAGSTRESRAARLYIGLQVLPHWEHAEIIRPDVGRRGQTGCDVAARFVDRNEIEPSIGADVHTIVGLIVQLERERQCDEGIAVIGVIPDVGIARHDRIGAIGKDVLLRRTTLDRVIPCEGRITIASFSSDRPGTNARRHAASKSEVYGERSCTSID